MTQATSTSVPRASASPLRRFAPFSIGLATMLALFAFWTVRFGGPSGFIDHMDFRDLYAGGYLERTQPTQLYTLQAQQQVEARLVSPGEFALPFIHPAYEALLFVPFSLLPYTTAYLAFGGFNILLIAFCVAAGKELFSTPIPFLQPRPALSILLFLPIWLAVLHGQDSILFLLLVILAWNQIDAGHPFRAGLLLGAALFKFQIAIPLAILLAVRKGGGFVRGFTLGAAAVGLLSLVAAPHSFFNLAHLLLHTAINGSRHGSEGYRGHVFPLLMANLYGLVFSVAGGVLRERSVLVLTILISVVFLALVAFRLRRVGNEQLAFAAAVLASLLASYHLYPHDLTPLLLVIVIIGASALPWKNWLTPALYFVPLAFFFFLGPNWFFLVSLLMVFASGAVLFTRAPQRA